MEVIAVFRFSRVVRLELMAWHLTFVVVSLVLRWDNRVFQLVSLIFAQNQQQNNVFEQSNAVNGL